MAPFVILYATKSGKEIRVAADEILIIRLLSRKRGRACCIKKNGAFAFTETILSKKSSVVSSIKDPGPIPALFTKISNLVSPVRSCNLESKDS